MLFPTDLLIENVIKQNKMKMKDKNADNIIERHRMLKRDAIEALNELKIKHEIYANIKRGKGLEYWLGFRQR